MLRELALWVGTWSLPVCIQGAAGAHRQGRGEAALVLQVLPLAFSRVHWFAPAEDSCSAG